MNPEDTEGHSIQLSLTWEFHPQAGGQRKTKKGYSFCKNNWENPEIQFCLLIPQKMDIGSVVHKRYRKLVEMVCVVCKHEMRTKRNPPSPAFCFCIRYLQFQLIKIPWIFKFWSYASQQDSPSAKDFSQTTFKRDP